VRAVEPRASEAQARRNSDRPEQREWWRDASQHLARVVTHDAFEVHRFRQGDADTAGFVQVIQGHSGVPERRVSLDRDPGEAFVWEAPHILAMTVAKHADRPGDFTQIAYFTSEQDARQFEPEPPVEAEELAQEERRRLMTNLRCFDLRDPQLLSPAEVYTY
jgi:hypothetical protein